MGTATSEAMNAIQHREPIVSPTVFESLEMSEQDREKLFGELSKINKSVGTVETKCDSTNDAISRMYRLFFWVAGVFVVAIIGMLGWQLSVQTAVTQNATRLQSLPPITINENAERIRRLEAQLIELKHHTHEKTK